MHINVARGSDGHDRAFLVRDDGTSIGVALVVGGRLPHDLVHYAVERALGLSWGFWGLLAAGAQLQSVRAFDARHPQRIARSDDPLLAVHLDDLRQAEALVNGFHSMIGPNTPEAVRDRLAEVFGADLPEAVATGDAVERVLDAIDDVGIRWSTTPPGRTLRLPWP